MDTDPLLRSSTSLQTAVNEGTPLDRSPVLGILIVVLCERLAYYSVLSNLILYCTAELGLSSTDAATINLLFAGSVFIMPFFGYIADVSAGKYNTVIAAGLLYILGLVLLFISAAESWFKYGIKQDQRRALYYSSLVLTALGAGGIRCNIGPLGAQLLESYGKDSVRTFFNWLYWFMNVGAMIAQIGVAYVQQEVGFCPGYFIPLVVIIIGLLVFRFWKDKYKNTQEEVSPFKEVVAICCLSRCGSLEKAEISQGGKYSHESVVRVQMFIKLFPMCALLIIYFTIYAQTASTFFLQSERLDISVGSSNVPLALLQSFDNLIILILIPVMQIVVYPIMDRYNRNPSLLQRIGLGMILASFSVIAAGVLEIVRKEYPMTSQIIANHSFNASSVSVFAQIPQFTLFGASEVFTSVSGMEFVYMEAPDLMKGICMGLYLETTGLGLYLALLILQIVRKIKPPNSKESWFPNEINDGRTENLFFMLAILMFLNFLLFVFAAKRYRYNKDLLDEEQTKSESNKEDTS